MRLVGYALLVAGLLVPASGQEVDVYSRPLQVEPSRDFDVQHYRVTLDFDLEGRTFRGENRITLVPLRDGWRRLRLHAVDLAVEAVRDSDGVALEWATVEGGLEVDLGRDHDLGETVELSVAYRGEDPQQGLYFDDETGDHPRMVSTDSWPDNARRWIPCYDYPHDKVTHELIVTAPAGNRVLSNGRLVGRSDDAVAGTTTWHWHQDRPHSTYLLMLAIGPFTVLEDRHGDLPVSYWVYPQDAEDAAWIFSPTPGMIGFFEQLYGVPFPWAKYDQVTTPHVGGGAEATSATVLGDQVIHDRRAAQDYSWERVIAHEIAHQWWGDLTTTRTWAHTWLNESFATWSDHAYTLHTHGPDEGAWDLKGKKDQYLQEARTRYMRPIVFERYERPHDSFDAHTYPKGAAVLETLRFVLGDGPFRRALGRFLTEHAFGAVDTHDFQSAVKDATGQNLDWFFEQWLLHPGHPVFDVSHDWDAERGELRLRVRQVQDISKGVPIYRTPVDIGLVTSAGKRVERVWLDRADHSFSFTLPERPLLVRFDEGNHLLKEWTFVKGLDELCYQAEHDDVIGREWAVGQLARLGGDERITGVLEERARSDPFWAVRRSALEAVAQLAPASVEALTRALAADPSSRVRAVALRLLGERGDPRLAPFLRARFEADDSYVAQAEALRALGRCGSAEDLSFLQRAATLPSPRGEIRAAALEALTQLEQGD